MLPYLALGGAGIAVLALALLLRGWRAKGVEFSPAAGAALVGVLLVASGLVYWLSVEQQPLPTIAGPPPGVTPPGQFGPLPVGSPTGPLPPGSEAPPLDADGWLNGSPPKPGSNTARFVVVDLWAHWCSGCRDAAPGLVAAFKKYEPRGVAFVSLTNMSESSAQTFSEQHDVRWPSGFGATTETIARWGAYSRERPVGGYELTPTLYLLGPDGKVRWSDRHMRTLHQDPAILWRELEAELERALAASPERQRPEGSSR